jgi:hypothetical protein
VLYFECTTPWTSTVHLLHGHYFASMAISRASVGAHGAGCRGRCAAGCAEPHACGGASDVSHPPCAHELPGHRAPPPRCVPPAQGPTPQRWVSAPSARAASLRPAALQARIPPLPSAATAATAHCPHICSCKGPSCRHPACHVLPLMLPAWHLAQMESGVQSGLSAVPAQGNCRPVAMWRRPRLDPPLTQGPRHHGGGLQLDAHAHVLGGMEEAAGWWEGGQAAARHRGSRAQLLLL